jgi:septal ring factor EnvC (AmiA/AmiB activator)
MSRRTGFCVNFLLVLVALGFTSLIASKAFTQSTAQPAQSEQTLPALLGEVHQLRVALQRSNLNTYHAQITIERMKIQQQHVDRLQARLADINNGLADTRRHLSGLSAYLKDSEIALARETDAAKRSEAEKRLRDTKSEMEFLTQREQQQQEMETQLNAQLSLEQGKLNELNERLDTLQRELEAQLSTDKPQPSGKRP